MHRIIYYYQTFIPLSLILFSNPFVTHIHLSSIHFGVNNDTSPYIHLNDYPPNSSKFDNVWQNLKVARENNIKNILMIGGAGGAYNYLFSNFEVFIVAPEVEIWTVFVQINEKREYFATRGFTYILDVLWKHLIRFYKPE